ncbi:MAG: methyltransferase domain-containing protein [Candidatus Omnitrophota bacterium]
MKEGISTISSKIKETADTLFICPTCATILTYDNNAYRCSGCGQQFDLKEGIPGFTKDMHYFSWNIPRENMEYALSHVHDDGWQETVLRLQDDMPEKAQKIWSRICNPRRWPWIFLLPIDKESTVLDIGCGWGNNSIALAKRCGKVYSMDSTFAYLRWLKAYAEETNVHNIVPVHGGDTARLPFRDNSFDCVAVSGVLEWIGASFSDDPQVSQQRFLNEISRILKKDGCVYIGIENRINYKYFLGRSEGHIGMKYGSLLPRSVTRALLRIGRQKDFKVYTYSKTGYRNMLRKASLNSAAFLAPIPSYSRINRFIPVCDWAKREMFAPLAFGCDSAKNKILMDISRGYFVPSFSIFAAHKTLKESSLNKLLNHVLNQAFGINKIMAGEVTSFKVKDKNTARLILKFFLNNGLNGFYLKVDAAPDAKRYLLKSASIIENLKKEPKLSDASKSLLPEVFCYGTYDGYDYTFEREESGRTGESLLTDVRKRDKLVKDAVSLIQTIHKNTAVTKKVDDKLFDIYFGNPIRLLGEWMRKEEMVDYGQWLSEVEKSFRNDLISGQLTLVCRHGDYVPNNCIIDSTGNHIKKILDWEYAEMEGLPLLDIISFLNRATRSHMRDKYPNVKFPGYPKEFFSTEIADICKTYLADIGVPLSLYKNLVFMWWAKYLEICLPMYRYDAAWRKTALFPVIESWKRIFESAE